ncbi:MAG: TonB-dependent receptor [Sphingomonadaceae bacterium]|nr:TonB-dependent receptor [Sphingomonadaceae bacterium]
MAQENEADQGTEAASPQSGIGEIIVTAQKRSENLQKTPAAVTAVSGEQLVSSGVYNLAAAQELVPGARFHQEGNTTQVFLRGIGSNLDFANVEPSVSFNFNGVNIPREGTSVPLFDIASFEVLPGPQGTLYGRSAIGGTVNVGFRRPEFTDSGFAKLEVGNYDLIHGTVVANAALSDQIAIRLGADYTYRDGFMETGSDSKDDIAVRFGLLYEPSSSFSLYTWAYTTNKHGNTSNLVNKGSRALYDNAGNLTGFAFEEDAFLRDRPWDDLRPGALASTAPFGQPTPSTQNYNNYAVGTQIDADLSDTVSLTNITGYVFLDAETEVYWLGVLPAYKLDKYRMLSNELRISGDTDKLKWLAGLFTYRNRISGLGIVGTTLGPSDPNLPLGGVFGLPFYSSNVQRNVLKGAAVFGQATYSVTDDLRITVGGRYGVDDKKANGISLEAPQNMPYTFDHTFKRFDYKVGVEYDVAPTVMFYATYQTGYQPGTFNEIEDLPGRSNLVKTGKMKGISGGFKARFLDDTLQINNEAFYYVYNDLAIQAYDASKLFNEIFNAGKVTIPGNQLDILYKPTTETSLNLSVSYVHARNKDFITPAGDNYNGLAGPYAADWTIAGGISQDFLFGSNYVRASVDARYESEWFADFIHNPGTRQAPYAKVNASLTYFDDDGWDIGVWGKNLTNEAVIAATAAAGIPGPATAYLSEPRTYGLRFGVEF